MGTRSAVSAMRPAGTALTICSQMAGVDQKGLLKSVRTTPGATAFTWMLKGASSEARTFVSISRPALAIP